MAFPSSLDTFSTRLPNQTIASAHINELALAVRSIEEALGVNLSGVVELARDTLGAALVAGPNVSITPDDGGNTITIGSLVAGANAENIGVMPVAHTETVDAESERSIFATLTEDTDHTLTLEIGELGRLRMILVQEGGATLQVQDGDEEPVSISDLPVEANSVVTMTFEGTGAHVLRQEFRVFSAPAPPEEEPPPPPPPPPPPTTELLFMPDYGVATNTLQTGPPEVTNGGLIIGRRFRQEQEPRVRGALQSDRMRVVIGGDIPGSGIHKPTRGAMRVEVRPYDNNNFTVTTVGDYSTTATALNFADPTVLANRDYMYNTRTKEAIRVNDADLSANPVTVQRKQSSTPYAINDGDTWMVIGGDFNDSYSQTNAYPSSRAEVADRLYPHATGSRTPPENWPDPIRSERWYGISVFVPSDFITNPGPQADFEMWLHWLQWKPQNGGTPLRAASIDGSNFDFGGARTGINMGGINKGNWTRFVFGFKFSNIASEGWSEAWRSSIATPATMTNVVPRRAEANMYTQGNSAPQPGEADPLYFKNGIYRTKAWTVTHVLYFSEPKIGTTYESVVAV